MSNIIINNNQIICRKPMWEEEEVTTARSMWFKFDTDTMTCSIDLRTTFRKALHGFFEYSYPAMWTQPQYMEEKRQLILDTDGIYKDINSKIIPIAKERLPWWKHMYAHQKQAVLSMYHRRVNMLSFQPRLGKTITAASLSVIHQIPRTLIICYDIGKYNFLFDLTDPKWEGEGVIDRINFTILDRQKRKYLEAFDEKFVVVNYESLDKFMDYIFNGGMIGHIIISECQKMKNHTSKTFRNIYKILEHYPDVRVTFESGTPVMNRTNDMFAYLRAAHHPLGENYADFKRQYSEVDRRHGTVTASINIPSLQRRISNFVIRRTQDECTDMPRHNYINVYFEMGEWQSEYRKAIYDHLHDSGKLAIESAIHSINLVMAKAKVPGIIEAIEALVESGEKVVVFCSYSSPLEDMRSHFGDACIVIDGKNHDKMTDAKRFKEDPTCMVALCNTKAAGHTIDLSVSSNLYVVNFPLSPKELEQASDRVKNLAKHHPCNVHFCIALGNDNVQTVDERLRELIGGKDADINWLLDGKEAKGVQEDVAEVLWREILLQYKSNEEAVGETVATGPGE